MTPEEVKAKHDAVPLPTDEEIADIFCTYAIWDFEPLYLRIASVAKGAGAARGLSTDDLRALSRKAKP